MIGMISVPQQGLQRRGRWCRGFLTDCVDAEVAGAIRPLVLDKLTVGLFCHSKLRRETQPNRPSVNEFERQELQSQVTRRVAYRIHQTSELR